MSNNFYKYSAEVTRVVDGDTYDFDVDLGFYTSKRIRVRMLEVDTHETYGVTKDSDEYKKGMEEKKFVEEWFNDQKSVYIETEEDEKGKYGRWLAKVYGDSDCLNEELKKEFDVAKD